MPRGGFNFRTAAEGFDASTYLVEYAAQRSAYFGTLALEVDEDGQPILVEEEVVEKIVVLERAITVPITELGTGPSKIMRTALDLGMTTEAWRSLIDVAPRLYVTDSKDGDKNPHQAGDVLYQGYQGRCYALTAVHPSGKLAFQANWMGKGGGTTASFVDAVVLDPVGIETELGHDYEMDYHLRKKLGIEDREAKAIAAVRREKYNDGATWKMHHKRFTMTGELHAWLDEWITLLNPELPRLSAKKKAPKEGEWIG